MTSYAPAGSELALLKALALPTQDHRPDHDGWWSAHDLRSDPRTHAEFSGQSAQKIHGAARGLVRKLLARKRTIGTAGHGWTEYRITNVGRAWTGPDGPGQEA